MDSPFTEKTQASIESYINEIADGIRAIRRYLHARPEASGREFKTTEYLSRKLTDAGVKHRIAPSGRGLIVDSHPASGEPRIAMRADIDALRLHDEKTVIYRSTETDLMHACGHDAHTAMLMGAILAHHHHTENSSETLHWRAIFQPAEETAQGALEMIEIGAMDNVEAIIALHVDPSLRVGEVGVRYGPLPARRTACRLPA